MGRIKVFVLGGGIWVGKRICAVGLFAILFGEDFVLQREFVLGWQTGGRIAYGGNFE